MRTFKKHLAGYLKNPKFQELYKEEKELLDLSLQLQEVRKKTGVSQGNIARQAHITQQQLSKLENGENCNILTYLKASRAMGYKLIIKPVKGRRLAAC
jgi:DNA-binding XRE family transcriptional regulator